MTTPAAMLQLLLLLLLLSSCPLRVGHAQGMQGRGAELGLALFARVQFFDKTRFAHTAATCYQHTY